MTEFQVPEVELDAEQMLRDAQDATGLSYFGDDSFREPMRVLIRSLNQEANLNAVGRFGQYQRIMNTLVNRLRAEEWIRKNPEILDEEIAAPVVIVGLQRTGTTMLHRTMASDSRFYAPLWYEVRNPAPYLDYQFKGDDQRVVEATAEVDAMLEANPEMAAIHPMDPIGADEDIMLLEHSFYSTVPPAFGNTPSYMDWLEANDNTPGYEYLKRMLQFLQWQKQRRGETGERWLLKTPHHLHHVDLLLKVFPDAQVICTHRDPLQTVPSAASFNYNLWIMGAENVDPEVVGKMWADKFAKGMRETLGHRKNQPSHFIDVWFRDTVNNPIGSMERVYEFIGLPLTDEAKSAMQKWRDENRREDRPSHEYTLEQFGFTEAQLNEQYAEYRAAFIDNRDNAQ